MNYPRHPAKRAQLGLILVGVLTLPIGVGLIFLITATWRHYSNTYSADGELVRANIGIISRDARSVRVSDLREIGLQQTILGRMLNYGTLTFDTAAGHGREVRWWGVEDAFLLREHFEEKMKG